MRRYRIRIRLKIYPVLWTVIILVSVYLLVKFAALTFSKDSGQAGLPHIIASALCNKVIEAEPSLISYSSAEENQASLIIDKVGESFALQNFIEDNSIPDVYAQGNSLLITDNLPADPAVEADTALQVNNDEDYIGFNDIAGKRLGLEYIMTNGAVIRSEISGKLTWDGNISEEQLNIGYLKGEISPAAEENITEDEAIETAAISAGQVTQFTMEQLKDVNFLVRNFYFVDASTSVTDSLFDAEKLINNDMTMKQGNEAPQILIYHTHSQEAFADSSPDKEEDTVVGIGDYLTKILEEDYGYNVIHDKTEYDMLKGFYQAYSEAEKGLKKDLEKNPTIEVMIDLHRDSGNAKIVDINGEETAQIMLFNGLCRDQKGPITELDNPYLKDNLAFSLQLQMESLTAYPGFFRRNYLQCYRFNLHLRPKSLLVEWGTVNNTVQSARNAVVPFARVLDGVLKGSGGQEDISSENVNNE